MCKKFCVNTQVFLDGYTSNFSIYSENDSSKLYKKIFESLSIENELRKKEKIKNHIAIIKNNNMSLGEYLDMVDYLNYKEDIEKVFVRYEDELKKITLWILMTYL